MGFLKKITGWWTAEERIYTREALLAFGVNWTVAHIPFMAALIVYGSMDVEGVNAFSKAWYENREVFMLCVTIAGSAGMVRYKVSPLMTLVILIVVMVSTLFYALDANGAQNNFRLKAYFLWAVYLVTMCVWYFSILNSKIITMKAEDKAIKSAKEKVYSESKRRVHGALSSFNGE